MSRMSLDQVQARARAVDVVLLPLGSTERHGSHLPMGTDAMTAAAVAEKVARRSGAVVAPPLDYGLFEVGGAVPLSPSTYAAVLTDVCGGLLEMGFGKVLAINAHGGNNRVIQETLLHLGRTRWGSGRLGMVHCLGLLSQLMPEIARYPLGHADRREAAIVMALDEGLVRLDLADLPERIEGKVAGELRRQGMHTVTRGQGSVFLCHDPGPAEAAGGYGSVQDCSAALGEEILDTLADYIGAVVKDLAALPTAPG